MIKFINRRKFFLLTTAFLAARAVSALAAGGHPEVHSCAALGSQTDTCICAEGGEHPSCSCKKCSANSVCECIKSLQEESGEIAGVVKIWRTKVKTEGPKNSKGVIVYLEKVGDNDFPPPVRHANVNQKGLVFQPHLLAIQKGTHIDFQNNDKDKHNVHFLHDQTAEHVDLGTRVPGEMLSFKFEDPGSLTVLCKLHLEMAAYVAIMKNPFYTAMQVDGDPQQGTFTLHNVPPGDYVLNTWHKRLKLKGGGQPVTVEKGKTTEVELIITKRKYAK